MRNVQQYEFEYNPHLQPSSGKLINKLPNGVKNKYQQQNTQRADKIF